MPPSPNVSITTITTTTVQSPSTAGSGYSNSTLSAVGVSAPRMNVTLSSSTGSRNGRQSGASPSCLNLTSASPKTKTIHLSALLLQLQVPHVYLPITTLSLLLGLHHLKWPTELISIALFSARLTMLPHTQQSHPPLYFLSHAPSTSPPFISAIHHSTWATFDTIV